VKACLLVFGIVAATSAMAPMAQAAGTKWCAYYSGSDGSKNCYFTSYQQCMADVSGKGGSCQRSPYRD
jgi:hypothetical protein